MKKLFLISIIFFAINAFAGEKISLTADEWCPYNCDPKTGKEGFMVDIAKEIFKKNDIEVEYVLSPSWEQAISDAESGKYHGVIGASFAETSSFTYPEVPLGYAENHFYTRTDDNWKYDNLAKIEDLFKGSTLGVIESYFYAPKIDDYILRNSSNPNIIYTVKGPLPLKTLIDGLLINKARIIIEDSKVLSHHLKENTDQNKVRDAGGIEYDSKNEGNLYIAFSNAKVTATRHAKILSDGIKELRKNGKLKEILTKYGVDDNF